MMNFGAILKAFGIQVPAATAKQIEALLPQLPQKVQQVIALISQAVQDFDVRLASIEQNQQEILRLLYERSNDDSDPNIRPAGAGATQRKLERIGSD